MASQTLAARVERLEQRVTTLEELPARVDALTLQILQLRDELRAEFSVLRSEFSALHSEMRTGDEGILAQVRLLHEDLVSKLGLMKEGNPRRPKRR